jgi:hypothetical protein
LVDKSRDILVKEQMAIVVRFVNKKGEVIEHFLGIKHVKDTTSKSLKKALVDMLSDHGLVVANIGGQEYDCASNMRGEFNGHQKLILDENPFAFYIHCCAHQLQLVIVAVSKIKMLLICPGPCAGVGIAVAVAPGITVAVAVLVVLIGMAILMPSSPSTTPKRSVVPRSSLSSPRGPGLRPTWYSSTSMEVRSTGTELPLLRCLGRGGQNGGGLVAISRYRLTGDLLDVYDDMPTGGAGGGRHEFGLGFGRRHYAACSLASGGCRRVLGLEFGGVAE